jgi:hypothetical protein
MYVRMYVRTDVCMSVCRHVRSYVRTYDMCSPPYVVVHHPGISNFVQPIPGVYSETPDSSRTGSGENIRVLGK